MSSIPTTDENFGFDPFDDYDPFAPAPEMPKAPRAEAAQAPAPQRIEALLERMKPRRRVLMRILGAAQEPISAASLHALVEELQEYDFSVFNAANYAEQLERAGALQQCDENGTPLGEDYRREPDIVEMDGARYWRPTDTPQVFWQVTPDGLAAYEADKPLERLEQLIAEDDPRFPEVYRLVLTLCEGEGRTPDELGPLVNDHPALQEPRRMVQRFLERLERCQAVEWRGTWQTTPVGRAWLEKNPAPNAESEA